MGKFVAYVKQAGEGCDYTIACGYELVYLKADNYSDAIVEIRLMLGDEGFQYLIQRLTLIEVAEDWNINVKKIYAEIAEAENKNKKKSEAKRMKDYAEYQRLKNQFENK